MTATPQAGLTTPRLRSIALSALLLLGIWCALDGIDSLAWGLPFAVFASLVAHWLAPPTTRGLRLVAIPGFALFFVVESLRGAVDVAWRAFHPRMPLDLGLQACELRLPPGAPRTLLVSCVSLLPGTLSADLDAAANRLDVHSLAGDPRPGLRALEARIARLYGLKLPAEA